jgi:hypothetical protein
MRRSEEQEKSWSQFQTFPFYIPNLRKIPVQDVSRMYRGWKKPYMHELQQVSNEKKSK